VFARLNEKSWEDSMADRDDHWHDERRQSDNAMRRPGGDRDFYNRDRYSEDDYGLGYGEEGMTNYRQRPVRSTGPYGDQQRDHGGRDQPGAYPQNRGPYGGTASRGGYGGQGMGFGGGQSRGQSPSELGYGRPEYGNPTNYSPSYDRDYRGNYNEGNHNDPQRYSRGGQRDDERGFFSRAGDEVSSWFGDDDAERRRQQDAGHSGRGPKGYRRSDDRIREDISDRLMDDPFIDASEVEVKVDGSEVTLSGSVDSRASRRRAEDLAERVSGVTHVQNNLRVSSGAETTREERAAGITSTNVFGTSTTGTTGGTTERS
jgi:osmotically-inducible protein OsmY